MPDRVTHGYRRSYPLGLPGFEHDLTLENLSDSLQGPQGWADFPSENIIKVDRGKIGFAGQLGFGDMQVLHSGVDLVD